MALLGERWSDAALKETDDTMPYCCKGAVNTVRGGKEFEKKRSKQWKEMSSQKERKAHHITSKCNKDEKGKKKMKEATGTHPTIKIPLHLRGGGGWGVEGDEG